jgi:hypothetical protein
MRSPSGIGTTLMRWWKSYASWSGSRPTSWWTGAQNRRKRGSASDNAWIGENSMRSEIPSFPAVPEWSRTMYKDEIIAEVWRNRDAYAEKHHHNLDEMVKDLQKRQKTSRLKLVDRRKRRGKQSD